MARLSISAGVVAAAISAATPAGAVQVIYSLGFEPGVARDDGAPIVVDRFINANAWPDNPEKSLSGGCFTDLAGVNFLQVLPSVGFANDSVANARLNPTGSQCYMVISPSGGSAVLPSDEVSAAGSDYSAVSNGQLHGYFGFHWGSVDSWNFLIVSDPASGRIVLPGDTDANGVLEGSEAAAAAGIVVDTGAGFYMNLLFEAADNAKGISWGNFSNNAFELTAVANVAGYFDFTPFGIGIAPAPVPAPVPAPAAALLLPLGLAGLMLARRRR